ncbi:MAG: rhodanese-like domain-containing protein [Nitrospirota bacterium]
MKKYAVMVATLVFVLTSSAFAANYLKPDVFRQWMETKRPVIIVDIQLADDFKEHHFKDSIETNAFPAKSEEEKKKLDKAVEKIKATQDDVVIVCPRGRSGASNSYEYIKSKGIPENRLYILEGGIAGWPYKEMFVKGREK